MKINDLMIMILMILCLFVSGEASEAPGMPVEVQKVALHTLKETIRAMGEVKASQDIKVSSQYSGRIIYLNTHLGVYIKKNDVIAGIRKKEAEALFSSGNHIMKDIKVFAPVSGYVVENFVSPGEIVVTGQPLTRIISPKHSYITINIPGEFYAGSKKGSFSPSWKRGKSIKPK